MGVPGWNDARPPLACAARRFVVLGLARSGAAALRLLQARGAEVIGVDEGGVPAALAGLRGVDVRTTADPADLVGAAALVLSPGIPRTHPLVRAALRSGLPVWAEIELAWRASRAPVVAITGTKGKSTTAAWLGHVLGALGVDRVVAGNIGRPYAEVVTEDVRERWVVLEVSSFQLESIDAFHPEVAVHLAISPDHLDRYDDLEAYAAAKARIARHLGPRDVLVVDVRDAHGRALAAATHARVLGIGGVGPGGRGVLRVGDELVARHHGEDRVLATAADVRLPGDHNVDNALAVLGVCDALGIWQPDAGRAALASFPGLEFRMQAVGEIGGIRFINDSKATTLEAVRAAVQGAGAPVMLALGGRNKGLDFRGLRDLMPAVRRVFVFGEAASELAQALAGSGAPVEAVGDLEDLVRRACARGRPGECLLFSPGCTSFDMFHDAEERGRAFTAAVRKVGEDVG